MTTRLPKYAERYFAGACSLAGALAHPPDEDERGWDFLVEFAKQRHPGHADTHPPPPSAFVQVKSSRRTTRSVRVKLSNALHAAQSRHPWFVVLLQFDGLGAPTHAYAVHVWDLLMRDALKAVRQAELVGAPLNKKAFIITFTDEDDHREDLISWMQSKIHSIGPDYEARKKHLHESLGYEDSTGTGHVTVEGRTLEEIAEGFLGLGDGLKLTGFKFTPSRFGLPDNAPIVDLSEGRLVISPNPVGQCEIRLRGPRGAAAYPGNVYAFSTPDMPDEQRRLRFSTQFLHLISAFKQEKLDFKLLANFDDKLDLVGLSEFSSIRNLMSVGPIDVQVWSGGQRVLAGALKSGIAKSAEHYEQLQKIVSLCSRIAGPSARNVKLSVSDFVAVWRQAVIFVSVNSEANIRLEYEPLVPKPIPARWLVYHTSLRVADQTFFTLLRRPVTSTSYEEPRETVNCGAPEILESYAMNSSGAARDLIVTDYQRHIKSYAVGEEPLELGDINSLFENKDTPLA